MSEMKRIADEMRRAFEGDAWHGPGVMEVLGNVNSATANSHPIRNAHSIWEIVNHITAWNRAVRIRLGGEAIELIGEDDWPTVRDSSEAAWQASLRALQEEHEKLVNAIQAVPDSHLESTVPGRTHSVYHMLHGLIQHDLYHAGQIVILRKAAEP